jgi:hypothetical protein
VANPGLAEEVVQSGLKRPATAPPPDARDFAGKLRVLDFFDVDFAEQSYPKY